MGATEKKLRKRQKFGKIERALLCSALVTGGVTVALIIPNAAKLLTYIPKDLYKFKSYSRHTVTKLIKQGFLTIENNGGKKYVRITESGRAKLEYEQMLLAAESRPKRKWDGHWRMVLFDIPEKRRRVRAQLRHMMNEIGFLRLQDSAWIYPYDCEDLIDLIKAELRVGSDVIYAIVDHFHDERAMRRHFHLPAE